VNETNGITGKFWTVLYHVCIWYDEAIVWHITRTLKDPSDMDCSSN